MDDKIQAARPAQYKQMYATTPKMAAQDAAVCTGTLLIHSALVVVLFDLGSTHTFLARAFVDRIGVLIDDLGHNLVISTLVGATLTIEVCVRGIPVAIEWRMLLTDFVVFPIGEFNNILAWIG